MSTLSTGEDGFTRLAVQLRELDATLNDLAVSPGGFFRFFVTKRRVVVTIEAENCGAGA